LSRTRVWHLCLYPNYIGDFQVLRYLRRCNNWRDGSEAIHGGTITFLDLIFQKDTDESSASAMLNDVGTNIAMEYRNYYS
jgi:hypothetical protein